MEMVVNLAKVPIFLNQYLQYSKSDNISVCHSLWDTHWSHGHEGMWVLFETGPLAHPGLLPVLEKQKEGIIGDFISYAWKNV